MEPLQSLAWTAFLMGVISACSLPIGALLAGFWRPAERTIAIFMAFGGGALLAALTIDLVGSALDQGHANALSLGAILGGLIFVALNRLVNDYGGFMRKASTTIYHLRRKEHERLRQIVRQLNQTDLFHNLSTRDYKGLAASAQVLQLSSGEALFHAGDKADTLYILIDGSIDLFAASATAPRWQAGRFDLPDWRASVLGTPQAQSAVARSDCELLALPRNALAGLLLNSPEFQQEVHLLLRSPQTSAYLQQLHGLSESNTENWLQRASQDLIRAGRLPAAIEPTRNSDDFVRQQGAFGRFALLQQLPNDELTLLGRHLIYQTYAEGEQLFHQGGHSDRLFLLDRGRISLITPGSGHQQLSGHQVFGALSLLSGGPHGTTAIALEPTQVWVLRRQDLVELLPQTPALCQALLQLAESRRCRDYLADRQRLTPSLIDDWTHAARHQLQQARLPPRLADQVGHGHNSQGAPLAIFLGITLDGIPESLVIGASMIHHQVSLSLIVGLFLSNFPEALSSSVGMRQQGTPFPRILLMWTGLMLLTGIGAALGSQFFVGASGTAYALVQGIAAGAMLTMIAETMLPEAYFKGGSVVGLSTLFGFLAAIFAKTLE